MKPLVPIAVAVTFLAALPAAARPHETFADRPARRQEKVRAARERALREMEEARQWASARGVKVRRMDNGHITELVAIRDGRPVYQTTENENAAVSTAADQVRDTAPFLVNGSNITVGVWDGGSVYTSHQEFDGRVSLQNPGSGVSEHATHVAGTIAAYGYSSTAQGMAPRAMIASYDWSLDESEMTGAAASFPDESGKIYLSNHSYGTITGWRWSDASDTGTNHWHFYGEWNQDVDSYFGQYEDGAREWDEIVFDAPYYLPFKSAGNDRNDGPPSDGDTVYYLSGSSWLSTTYSSLLHAPGDGEYKDGYDTIPTKGNAKNLMTVGALRDAVDGSSRSLAEADMTSFSGWGPSDDGRIKPDIVANGSSLRSCGDDSISNYTYKSGTSMSTPNASGSAALLADYYDNLFPGDAMRASTLKGLIIHTADDLGNPGPDYRYGWGLMNTRAAAELLADYADNGSRLTEETVSPSARSDSYVLYGSGTEPVRVTLCWTDPPGSATTLHDNRSPRLVNDLDLRITGPGGTFRPYRLDYNNPTNDAVADAENNVDNVEQVYIAAPIEGRYTVTVDYDGTLSGGSQWYSLLVSGLGGDRDGDGLPDYWETAHFLNPTGAVATVDSDGDGADNLTEYVSGHLPDDSNSVFAVSDITPPPAGNVPFILTWPTVTGRLYSVSDADSLFSGFDAIPDAVDLPSSRNSYTDAVERTEPAHFYRVEVRMDP